MFEHKFMIGERLVGTGEPVFIVAEAGVNHCGDMNLAKRLVDAALSAGADAVKFQSFKTERLINPDVEKASYQKKTSGGNESQFEMLKRLEFGIDRQAEIQEYCRKRDIVFLTTPFDEESLEDLDSLDLPAFKISSTDLTNLPMLSEVAVRGKPVFLSTGMSFMSEVGMALQVIGAHNQRVVLLQCTANYPAANHDANLAVLTTYREAFQVPLGFSDHTVGIGAAPYSVPLGVCVIEKHLTLDRSMSGPDHQASLEPDEFAHLVRTIRQVETFMGSGEKVPCLSEVTTRQSLQKCIVASVRIDAGTQFSRTNLATRRTGGEGIPALYYDQLLNQYATVSYEPGDPVCEYGSP